MNNFERLKLLFGYATELQFERFDELFGEMEQSADSGEIGEAYLMRAQIKLFAADISFLADLQKADSMPTEIRFPALPSQWKTDSYNRSVVFRNDFGAVEQFSQNLDVANEKFGHWYGERGLTMVRQIKSDICYFLGEFAEAKTLAEKQIESKEVSPIDVLVSKIMQFRCNLAIGESASAEENMLDTVRLSRANPELQGAYQVFRQWVILTTNWSGDSPRYSDDREDVRHPRLEDRVEGIRQGIDKLSNWEVPFYEYAKSHYENAYTLRKYYMDVFSAVYWLLAGDFKNSDHFFKTAYDIAQKTGQVSPFIEFGEQILLLFHSAKERGLKCSEEWIEKVSQKAKLYEKGIREYRRLDV